METTKLSNQSRLSKNGEYYSITGVGISVLPGEKGQTGIHSEADEVGDDGRQRRPRRQRMAVGAQQGQRRGQIRIEMKGRPQEEFPHHGGFHRREKAEQVHADGKDCETQSSSAVVK